jgi:hypothetical protein
VGGQVYSSYPPRLISHSSYAIADTQENDPKEVQKAKDTAAKGKFASHVITNSG